MKAYAIKLLADNSIQIIQCKGNPEQFMPFHIETSGAGTDEDPIVETKVLDAELVGELPKDEETGQYIYPEREFRASWRKSGASSIAVNLTAARAEKMDKLRAIRDELLKATDEEYVKLLSQGADLTDIQARKQELRDMPTNRQAEIDAISDVEELKNYMPAELA